MKEFLTPGANGSIIHFILKHGRSCNDCSQTCGTVLITADGEKELELMSKDDAAHEILTVIRDKMA